MPEATPGGAPGDAVRRPERPSPITSKRAISDIVDVGGTDVTILSSALLTTIHPYFSVRTPWLFSGAADMDLGHPVENMFVSDYM
ncbi:hypothetical protein Aph01nite_43070 [Acrocarpospora phusangensis]|uniref:Uncharacterized protein n=1 Tax=Acrocarpospora phusangensis TaxID=1070424 RepID=A0A919UPR7_9ACTN|nr:hypothetical protein Aph01nite_43070 [Acrocarpospora phusangensis]